MIIDVTNEILTAIRNELSDVTVLSSYQVTDNSFPVVVVEEIDNSDNVSTRDSAGGFHCAVSIRVEIYTNGPNRMSEAKMLRNTIDSVVSDSYGMTRVSQESVPNFSDTSIFRYQIVYSCLVSKYKTIFRR